MKAMNLKSHADIMHTDIHTDVSSMYLITPKFVRNWQLCKSRLGRKPFTISYEISFNNYLGIFRMHNLNDNTYLKNEN